MRRPGPHRVDVKRLAHLPDEAVVVGRGRAPREQAEHIGALDRAEACVEVVGHARRVEDRDGGGLQVPVQRLGQAERVPVAFQIRVGHLARGVDARVGPSGRGDPRAARKARVQPRQRGLDRALDRGQVRLRLPARERAARIFDQQRITGHGPVSARPSGRRPAWSWPRWAWSRRRQPAPASAAGRPSSGSRAGGRSAAVRPAGARLHARAGRAGR